MQKIYYINILIFIISALLITTLIGLIAMFLNKNTKLNNSKLLSYETGCLPTSDNVNNFSIHFYIIGIIFLILDIEIILLFPWVLGLKQLGILGFYKILMLWGILALGFIYEWANDSLKWIK